MCRRQIESAIELAIELAWEQGRREARAELLAEYIPKLEAIKQRIINAKRGPLVFINNLITELKTLQGTQ